MEEATLIRAADTRAYAGASRLVITAGYFGSFFSIGLALASLGPVLPTLSARSGISLESSGLLFVGRSCGYVVGSLAGGVIFDTMKRTHLPLIAGNVLCALGCAILPSLRSLPALAAALFAQGTCMGLLDTGGNVLLIWLHGAGRVEPFMQAMHFFFALGAVLSPLLIEAATRLSMSGAQTGDEASGEARDEALSTAFRSAGAFYIMAAVILASSAPLALYRGPQRAASEGSSSSSSSSSSGGGSGRDGDGHGDEPSQGHASTATSSLGLTALRRIRALSAESRLITFSALCLCLYVGVEVAFGGWIFTFALTELKARRLPPDGFSWTLMASD
jgi:FHS family Na+ dependent glucose MFS transporter 1